ncbi:MAG: TolC family protein [Vulcanimicrobiaceae bacterium]
MIALYLAAVLTLDLPHAVTYALKHDPTLLSRRAEVAQVEADYVKLHAAELPSVNGQLQSQVAKSYNMPGQLAQYGVSPTPEFSLNTAQVSSTWNLWNGGLAQLQAQQAKRRMEAARLDLRRAEEQKTIDIASAYYALADKRFAVALDRGDRLYQQALLSIAQVNERVGRVAGVDVLRAQSAEARSEATLATDEAEAQNSGEALAQQIGAPLETEFTIPQTLPEPAFPSIPLAQMVAVAEKSRPDIASASAQLGAAIVANRAIDSDLFPQLAVNAAFGNQFSPTAYGVELASAEQINPLLAAAGLPLQALPPRGNPGFWSVGATATLGFPIVDWGTRHFAHRAARAQIDALTAAFDGAKRAVELDVRSSFHTAQASFTSLAYAKTAASAGDESARIAQLQYRSGVVSFADARSAQQQALGAETDLQNARAKYLLSLLKLRISLGTYEPAQAAAMNG